ncbi:hypothetical protein PQX77_015004 [Marasmius sp. AFHP31]|nr:hypothetical protein PQX77_015004 [Marasmius sp. AFHP31]
MTEYDFSPDAYRRHMEKQDGVRRWAERTGQFHPANPFTPTTPSVQAMALKDSSRHRSGSSSGHKKHRSRSVGGSSTPPNPSRSNSYAYTPVSSPLSPHSRPHPQRSSTMPIPPPRPQPRRSNTSATTHPIFYRPGEPVIVPQGASITIIPPAPPHHYQQQQYFTPQPRKSLLSKIGSFFSSPSSRAQSPNSSGVVYVQRERSKSSKKSRSSRHGHGGERRYSY